ncbi:MAG: hypothetical protein LBQ50_03625 [Planctomycetaceae bacterium]|nr:hypothetical protein [Planctomycetaceae bacterium]
MSEQDFKPKFRQKGEEPDAWENTTLARELNIDTKKKNETCSVTKKKTI